MKSEREFKNIWLKNVSLIEKFLTKDIYEELGRHNWGYKRIDLSNYYKTEWRDYWEAYKLIYKSIGGKEKYVIVVDS